MDIQLIKSKLKTNPLVGEIFFQEEVDSTNLWAARTPEAKPGDAFITEFQTQGYGRQKRIWESPRGKNILMTFIDKAPLNPAHTPQITLVTGVAFAKALKGLGVNIQLKWPNDLFVNKKKLGGIICEASAGLIRIGVGLNVNSNPSDYSDEVKGISTSLFRELGHEFSREEIIVDCLNQYEKTRHLFDLQGSSALIKKWEEYSIPLKTNVELVENGKVLTGTYQGVSPDGYVLIQIKDKVEQFMAGDLKLI